jgi:hypothetical protein
MNKAEDALADFMDGFGMQHELDEESLDYLVDYALWKFREKLKEVADGLGPLVGAIVDRFPAKKPDAKSFKMKTLIDPTIDFEMEREEEIPYGVCVLHGGEWDGYKIDPKAEGYPPQVVVMSRDKRKRLTYKHRDECDYVFVGA